MIPIGWGPAGRPGGEELRLCYPDANPNIRRSPLNRISAWAMMPSPAEVGGPYHNSVDRRPRIPLGVDHTATRLYTFPSWFGHNNAATPLIGFHGLGP